VAEVYDKAKTTYAGLKKKADEMIEGIARIGTNAEKQKGLALEAADEISRRVQTLKDGGKTGTAITDFDSDAEIKKLLSYIAEVQGTCDKLEADYNKIAADAKVTSAAMKSLVEMLDKEVTERTKKKDRKIAAVDSKSLPDLEKLLKEARTKWTELKDHVIEDPGFLITKGLFDKFVASAVKETKESRTQRDAQSEGDQALNMRVFTRKSGEAISAYKEIVASCTHAVASLRDNKIDDAKGAVTEAKKSLKTLLEVEKFYSDIIKRKNKYDIEAMKQGKDGQTILKTLAVITKNAEDAAQLVKAASSKVS